MNPLTSEILAGQRAAEDSDAPSEAPGGPSAIDEVAEQTITTTDDRTDDAHAVPFRDLGVSDTICQALEAEGIFKTFPIQALALPIALGGYDIIGQARTGTGKTLGFGIPLLQRLADGEPAAPKSPHALVVAPTRELAIQIADDLRMAGSGLGTRVLTLYGGRAYEPQIEALRAGVDVVVSTPGRLLDLVGQRHLELGHVQMLVLDEADKMLDLGFLPDVERILQLTPDSRQTMMFSATMPGEVVTLARRHLQRPTHVRAETQDAPAAVPQTQQHVFRTHQMDKIEILARLLQAEGRGLTMVFTQTKRAADQVAGALKTRGFAVAAVHGDLGQGQREQALRAFRAGKVDVLVATDVAARGLDVDDVTHVVNFECPDDEKTYLHRIGRTGRAGKDGVAVTFVDWRDMQRWKLIDTALNLGQAEPAETYSTSDHLYTELGIAREVTGTLPRALRSRAGLDAEAVEDIGETGGRGAPHGGRGGSGGGGRGRNRSRRDRGPGGDGHTTGSGGHDDTPRERKPRTRRRTRRGQEVGAEGATAASGAASAPAAADGQGPTAKAAEAGKGGAAGSGRTRRRRSRGGQSAAAHEGHAAATHEDHAASHDGQSSAAS
ncbi:MAG: DEAD/DEAH box helicase [Actinobacteria bacterium]|nr:DEAD/DEAH box helicase [Actinomycetota bacterium]